MGGLCDLAILLSREPVFIGLPIRTFLFELARHGDASAQLRSCRLHRLFLARGEWRCRRVAIDADRVIVEPLLEPSIQLGEFLFVGMRPADVQDAIPHLAEDVASRPADSLQSTEPRFKILGSLNADRTEGFYCDLRRVGGSALILQRPYLCIGRASQEVILLVELLQSIGGFPAQLGEAFDRLLDGHAPRPAAIESQLPPPS